MKTASQELITLLNTADAFAMADCYCFTRLDGSQLRVNSSDIDLVIDGKTYTAGGGYTASGQIVPLVERSKTRLVRGVQVDSLEVLLYLDAGCEMNGTPILTLLRNGGFDGARLTVLRAFLPDWSEPVTGTVKLFVGRVSDVQTTRTRATLTIRSDLELLNIQMPRRLYQPGCANTLFDPGCTLRQADFTYSGMINGPSSKTLIRHSNPAQAGFFSLGVVRFDTGLNAGVTRTVRDSQQGQLTFSLPLPLPPTPGDTFTAWPGCDKTQAMCSDKFKNLAHFCGAPYVPVPETAY